MTHPRIERLKVTNFQSLGDVDLELGPFTVIVGPSNSGKSAVLRALKAVVRNVNSPSAVRVGKNVFTSQIEFSENSVSIERGKSQSTYRLNLANGTEEVYTKAGRGVPTDIQRFLALPDPEGPDLVFSSQIDPPWLLDETGSTVAKILGDLTNVSKLHEAAKESNRRRLEASRLQKIRQEDAQACADKMEAEFSDLRANAIAVKEARADLDSVIANARQAAALNEALEMLKTADAAEEDLRVRLEELPQPADIEELASQAGALLGERHAILDILDSLVSCERSINSTEEDHSEAASEAQRLDEEYARVLKEAGECPTCGQKITA